MHPVSQSTTHVSHPDVAAPRPPIPRSTSVNPLRHHPARPQLSPTRATTRFATAPSRIPLARKRGVVAESCAALRWPEVRHDHGVVKGPDRSAGGCVSWAFGFWYYSVSLACRQRRDESYSSYMRGNGTQCKRQALGISLISPRLQSQLSAKVRWASKDISHVDSPMQRETGFECLISYLAIVVSIGPTGQSLTCSPTLRP